MGSPLDPDTFLSAVIDDRAFAKNKEFINHAEVSPDCTILGGGKCNDRYYNCIFLFKGSKLLYLQQKKDLPFVLYNNLYLVLFLGLPASSDWQVNL